MNNTFTIPCEPEYEGNDEQEDFDKGTWIACLIPEDIPQDEFADVRDLEDFLF